jgi:serine/threonine-protein kinase SRPK3
MCMVFEVLGSNLLDLIKRFNYRGVPMPVLRSICKQILIGLDYLHSKCAVIHTDLKPENVLLLNALPKKRKRDDDKGEEGSDKESDEEEEEHEEHEEHGEEEEDEREEEREPEEEIREETPQPTPKKGKKKGKKKKQQQKKRDNSAGKTTTVIDLTGLNLDSNDGVNEEPSESQDKSSAKDKKSKTKKEEAKNYINYVDIDPDNPETYKVKIADFGNACWIHEHFTNDIQTRQYRAPEVILGCKYSTAVDMWSMGCMVFEFATGDLLFEPKSDENFDKNDGKDCR